MKKLLLILTLSLVVPAWALCPIENGESVCTLPVDNPSGMQLFQNNNTINSNTNINKMTNTLQPSVLNNSFIQNQNGIQMQGSLGCQFGNCEKGGNNDFLKNQ